MAVPRILMLPGYTQNAAIFSELLALRSSAAREERELTEALLLEEGKMGAIRRAIKDSAELVFVDPVRWNPACPRLLGR